MKIQTLLIAAVLFQQSLSAQQSYPSQVRTSGNEPVAKGKFEPTWQSLKQ